MSQLTDITVACRQGGVDGRNTGARLFDEVPGAPLEDVVEALAFAGFPPFDTIMGATEYSTSTYGGENEYEHRQAILDKMSAVGYPQNEIDDAVATIWRG